MHFQKLSLLFFSFLILLSFNSSAANNRRSSPQISSSSSYKPSFSYDLGLSSGTYGGYSYTEINFGLNWYMFDYINWRNAVFTRFGDNVEKAGGLDSSVRFELRDRDGDFGYHLFAGPGYRFSSKTSSGIFAEAGATIRVYNISFGLGFKALQYNSPGLDPNGNTLPKSDTSVFLILAAGGIF